MKNLQINESSIGAQEYNLVELVGSNINVYQKLPPPGLISIEESTAADYCLYDKSNDKLIIVKGDTDLSNYPIDNYTPIGVVVVPGTHNVYGDGSCGIMSLKEMNYSTPDTGSTSYQGIYWGQCGYDLSITNHITVARGNTEDGSATGDPTYDSYLPSDQFSSVRCLHDTDAYYYNTKYTLHGPSPYKTDGSRNPGYSQTSSPSSSSNVLSDFDGRGNSKILWEQVTAQSNWETASTITNDRDGKYSPAACCCWRYHTEGTQQGDWYLPAGGELGYIMPPFTKINEAITKMRNTYGTSVGVTLDTNLYYWSSSEGGRETCCTIGAGRGDVSAGTMKRGSHHVRAWLRVSPDGKPVNS